MNIRSFQGYEEVNTLLNRIGLKMTEISMQKSIQTLLKCHVSTHLSSTESQPFQVQRHWRLFITVADNVRDD